MSSAKMMPGTLSSHKKNKLDRFIPHTVARALFASDEKPINQNNYQELLGQSLLTPKITPKILKFGD